MPGDTRLIVDNRDLSAGEPVEERGFPDIWASDDGDGGHGWRVKAESSELKGYSMGTSNFGFAKELHVPE